METLLSRNSATSVDHNESCGKQGCSQTWKLYHLTWNSRLVLLLTRGGVFILGVAILIAGGVLSQQTLSLPYGNSTQCGDE